jgi:hypothetical protein
MTYRLLLWRGRDGDATVNHMWAVETNGDNEITGAFGPFPACGERRNFRPHATLGSRGKGTFTWKGLVADRPFKIYIPKYFGWRGRGEYDQCRLETRRLSELIIRHPGVVSTMRARRDEFEEIACGSQS